MAAKKKHSKGNHAELAGEYNVISSVAAHLSSELTHQIEFLLSENGRLGLPLIGGESGKAKPARAARTSAR